MAHDWVGRTLADRYEIIDILGVGGMGVALKAIDLRLGKPVVVKTPHPHLLADAEFLLRFAREVEALAEISHPHIVQITDTGTCDTIPYAVLQHLSGGVLDECAKPMEPAEVSRWLTDVASALDFMHSNGLVHRDIKPGNVLFGDSGSAYVADFGIVKDLSERFGGMTHTGVQLGTLLYMAPELVLGDSAASPRSDQYALAATVYEMLAGHPPHQANSIERIAVLLATEEPVSLHKSGSISPKVSRVVAKALHKNPAERFDTCSQFAASFAESLMDKHQQGADSPSGIAIIASIVAVAAILIFALLPEDHRDDQPTAFPPAVPVDDKSIDNSRNAVDSTTYAVVFETTAGEFTVEVHPDWAPRGAARFKKLIELDFYDGCRFFRVVPGFMVQWGMNGNPNLNSQWSDNNIQDDPVIKSNTRGYMSFAKTGAPNSRSTQLFINYADNSQLDGQGFSPFAIVTKGMNVVDVINAEYREQPNQGAIAQAGNAYLTAHFPRLDYILKASIVAPEHD